MQNCELAVDSRSVVVRSAEQQLLPWAVSKYSLQKLYIARLFYFNTSTKTKCRGSGKMVIFTISKISSTLSYTLTMQKYQIKVVWYLPELNNNKVVRVLTLASLDRCNQTVESKPQSPQKGRCWVGYSTQVTYQVHHFITHPISHKGHITAITEQFQHHNITNETSYWQRPRQ